MNFPRYKAGPVEYWLGAAFTEFVNGFISGWRSGVITGGGTGALTGATSVGADLTALEQVSICVASTLLGMVGAGLNQFSKWHEDGHPFPNPWPTPTGTTVAPFTPSTLSTQPTK